VSLVVSGWVGLDSRRAFRVIHRGGGGRLGVHGQEVG
jgi:hypothetical protein